MSNNNQYSDFLETKQLTAISVGIEPTEPHALLFDFQKDIVRWALRKGRAAIFADCGLGKTLMQLEWARQIPGKVLILAPLAVAEQTVREGAKVGLEVVYSRTPVDAQITITNYQQLHNFNPEDYVGVVLDESSIIKHFEGKLRNQIIDGFRNTPYRLACTATPAPNDFMELGNHLSSLDCSPALKCSARSSFTMAGTQVNGVSSVTRKLTSGVGSALGQ
jgi:superfamily II DNA or RNA helicase